MKVQSADPNKVTQEVIGANGQAVDLAQVTKYDGTVCWKVDKDGNTTLTRINRAQGNATVLAGNAYIVVTHGMGTTPSENDITVTPKDDLLGRTVFVSTCTATTFRINISTSDAVDHLFGWEGDV
jgi:hypothetical protein